MNAHSWFFDELAAEADRLWRDFARRGARAPSRPVASWRPAVDVIESDRETLIVAQVPGVRRESLRVVVCGDVVAIEGCRDPWRIDGAFRFLRKEIDRGPFAFAVRLPRAADSARTRAGIADGCLTVVVPGVPAAGSPSHEPVEIRL